MNDTFTITFTLDSCMSLKPIDFARIKTYIGDYSFSLEKLEKIMSYINENTLCIARCEWATYRYENPVEETPQYSCAELYVKTKEEARKKQELEDMVYGKKSK